MKEGWKYKKLGEVANITAGQGAPQGDDKYCDSGTPFIKAGNLEDLVNGLSEESVLKVSEEVAKAHKLKRYPAGSVLFAKSGMSCMKGWVHTLKRDCYVVSHIAIITPYNIDSNFLNYYFRYIKTYSLVQDAAYPTISLKDIESLLVPIPSNEDQKVISMRLDAAFAGIDALKANAERQLAEARALFNRALTEEMTPKEGWEKKNVVGLCKIINGYAFPSTAFSDQGAVKSIKITNVGVGVFIDDERNNLPQEYLNTAKDAIVYESDIVVALTRTIISDGLKVAIVPESYNGSLLNQRVAALRAFPKEVVNTFLYYYFKTPDAKKYVLKKVNTLMQPNLSIVDLRKMSIPCPSLAVQHSIVTRLDALSANVRKLEEVQRKTLAECDALKQAMLKEVFE